jgi:hypothetical protein
MALSRIVTEDNEEGLSFSSLPGSGPMLLRFQATGSDKWTTYSIDLTGESFFLPVTDLPDEPGIFEVVVADSTGPDSVNRIQWISR